ncbi:Uma2 family endonuclease [Actinomadura sp. WMMB 499]|uniref:Uma2 family endonuclease n=1 Tax=Actinomadura sp. WMMB 499 TaxID=1219491 RepID=UPI0012440BB7|nr:Uma2 family endonuclease [Actinomadura sp. WMMB 499]QFG19966.1 Uma2 family endonuclease [Actinomadura sp. WMMB 499]
MGADAFNNETVARALEQLAEFAETKGFTFSKFEARGDEIVMLAGTRWEHDAIIALIRRQIPRDIFCQLTNVDLKLTSEPREPIPNLIVIPDPLAPGAKPWAHETELLVEVVSQRNYRSDYEGKRERYARSGAPQYLLVDPRDGLCVLYTEPIKAEGAYREVSKTAFGEPIPGIFCMDGADLDTSEFLRYT